MSQELFFNRELSWVAFNRRVMELAQDPTVPLLERVRFLSIAVDNLDEFLMVRIAGLKAQKQLNPTRAAMDGRTPQEQLEILSGSTHNMMDELQDSWSSLRSEIADIGINIYKPEQLDEADIKALSDIFERDIFPILTPLTVDPAHPFPFLPNKELSLILRLVDPGTDEHLDAIVPMPSVLPRFIKLPDREGEVARYVALERVIIANLMSLFPPFELRDFSTFRVIRDG